MPTVNCGFGDGPYRSGREELVFSGPTLLVQIGYDPDFEDSDAERPNISDDLLPALVDTGATESCIDADFAQALGLLSFGRRDSAEVVGIGGPTPVDHYLAQIYMPELNRTIYGLMAGVQLRAGNQPYYALIGRTFLQNFTLHYQGRTGAVTLSDD